jgi:hypothetical protein
MYLQGRDMAGDRSHIEGPWRAMSSVPCIVFGYQQQDFLTV